MFAQLGRVAAVVALAGCDFSGPAAGGVDGGDAAVSCAELWGERAFFDPCTQLPTEISGLQIDGPANLNSDTGVLVIDSNPQGSHGAVVDLDGISTRLIAVDGLVVSAGGELRMVGTLPVALAVDGDVDIAGVIDLSSFWTGDTVEIGAGGNPASCPPADLETPAGLQGTALSDGGGGGGGGGFGGAGGAGGDGKDGDAAGAGGGAALGISAVRGGCPGGRGGEGQDQSKDPDNTYAAGLGGAGGGALLISATGTITITGTIHAGGAAGRGQTFEHRHAGGGGGSGGLIAIEGPDVSIEAQAVLAANGGGAGAGANNTLGPELHGSDALLSDQPAPGADGGDANPTAVGGDGGALGSPAGGGVTSDRGGGGGGGGTGYILVIGADNPAVDNQATVSPAAVEREPSDI